MSTETRRLVRTDSPGRPPRLSHSSWTMNYYFFFFFFSSSNFLFYISGADPPHVYVHASTLGYFHKPFRSALASANSCAEVKKKGKKVPLQWRRRCWKAMLRVCSLRLGSSTGACDWGFSLLTKLVFKSAANSLTVCFVWLVKETIGWTPELLRSKCIMDRFYVKKSFCCCCCLFVCFFFRKTVLKTFSCRISTREVINHKGGKKNKKWFIGKWVKRVNNNLRCDAI